MNEPLDAWGTPGYFLLNSTCLRAVAIHQEYEVSGREEDLRLAIEGFELVLDAARDIDIRFAATNGLGTAIWSRFERYGRPEDLDRAIELFRGALADYPNETTLEGPAVHANLGAVLQMRWRITSAETDLTESVTHFRAAVESTVITSPRLTGRLNGLSSALCALYVHRGDSSALSEAVTSGEQAVGYAPGDPANGATAYSNLAETLRIRYHSPISRGPADLDAAARHARIALAAVEHNRLLRPRFQANLASVLHDRFAAVGNPGDLTEAVALAGKALRATPAGHPNRPERLHRLSTIEASLALFYRGPRRRGRPVTAPAALSPRTPLAWLAATGPAPGRPERRALRKLTKRAAAALAGVPAGHVLRSPMLLGLGTALATEASAERNARTWQRAQNTFRRLAYDPAAPTEIRIAAAWRWAATLLRTEDPSAACAPLELAVELLPRTAPQRVTSADREQSLGNFAGLARDAAACALHDGRPHRALELLEHGRGILFAHALDRRTDTAELQRLHPDLAERFERVRSGLNRPDDSGFSTGSATAPGGLLGGEERHLLAGEWDELVDTVRRLPGFEDFLRSPQAGDLIEGLPPEGPVVIVNVSPLRCDALLLVSGELEVVPLPGLRHDELVERAGAFRSATAKTGYAHQLPPAESAAANQTITRTLEWLWDTVAEPVLRSGALRDPAGGLPSRLWWIPTGPLTLLPLHAAGRTSTPDISVLDQVVSSYAPTVRALRTARRTEDPGPRPPRLLAVALPTTPGLGDLPGAATEVSQLRGRRPDSLVLTGEHAVRRAVLDALPHHSWVHFACHAVSSADGPTPGYLALDDHSSAPLTVTDIARLQLHTAELAYLSACSTGIASDGLHDEAFHIAGACNMAGFRHVIGTLWTVRDAVAVDLADHFYAALEPTGFDSAHAAFALHAAVRRIRDENPNRPALWAQYFHVGP
ncbi:CHAT domain-containing protein [Nocardia sp. NPDC019395]|uniref:CHAT domain-containing protein n=1 Tax=Nocardia sp. NPDC019395 TaxID=3154686 RepID=UPI0033DBD180